MSWRSALTPRRLKEIWYAPVLLVSMALMLTRLLGYARLLSLESFAGLSLGLLASATLGMTGCLGLQSLLQRDMPVQFVRGRHKAALALLIQSVLVAWATAISALVALAIGALFLPGPVVVLGLGIVHGLSQQTFLLSTTDSRSQGHTLRYARQHLLRAAVVVSAGLAIAHRTGAAEAVLAAEAMLSLLMSQVQLNRSVRTTIGSWASGLGLAWRRRRQIPWPAAWTFLAVSALGFVQLNVDRWIASVWLEPRQFAQYSFAATLLAIAMQFQSLVNASVYPMMARLYARSGAAAAYALASALSIGLLVLGGAGALACVPLGAHVVSQFFAKYQAVAGLLPLFMAIGVLRLADFWTSYLMIVGHESLLMRLNLGILAGAALLWLLWQRMGGPGPLGVDQVATMALVLSGGAYAITAFFAWQRRGS